MSEVSVLTSVPNAQGVHARPSSLIVKLAGGFACDINIENVDNGLVVDAKSLLEVMTITAPKGTSLRITAAGEDASEALDAVRALIEGGFEG